MDPLSVFSWVKTRNAIEELQMLLQCLICQKQPKDPLSMGTCDHFFCAECLSKEQTNACPVCKLPSSPIQHKPDAIVSGLVTCSSDILTLISGGKISRDTQSLEAPPDVNSTYKVGFKNPKSDFSNSSNKIKGKMPLKRRKISTKLQQNSVKPEEKAPIEVETKTPSNSKWKDIKYSSKNESSGGKSETNDSSSSTKKRKTAIVPPSVADKRNSKGETVLHAACVKGDFDKVRRLLDEGANPNTKDNAGWTPLHEACNNGFSNIVKYLLENGAIVDAPGSNNTTPLHDAIANSLYNIIILLRKWGASDKVKDVWGKNARYLADYSADPEECHSALNAQPDHNLKAITRNPTHSYHKIVFTASNLNAKGKKNLDNLTKLLRGKVISEFSIDVTHVIAYCQPGTLICQRTMKYLMGIACGKLILSSTWVEECLSEGGYVDPLPYEITGSTLNPSSFAPFKGRRNFALLNPGLFSGLHVYFQGSFSSDVATKKDLESMIKFGGGFVLQREPNPEAISETEQTVPFYSSEESALAKCSHLCIYQEGPNEPLIKYDMPHIKTFPLLWLFESIDNCALIDPFK